MRDPKFTSKEQAYYDAHRKELRLRGRARHEKISDAVLAIDNLAYRASVKGGSTALDTVTREEYKMRINITFKLLMQIVG